MRHSHQKLLVSYQKPHRPVSKDTVSRWLKHTFGAHSTRAASTSAAKAQHLSIKTIIDSAGWSSENTFMKYYNKAISKPKDYSCKDAKNFNYNCYLIVETDG